MKRLLLFVFLFCLLPVASAYYADVTIEVFPTGEVTIQGTTNHPDLLVEQSQAFTSKEASYWLLNISKDGIINQGVVQIILPVGAEVNYFKAPALSRFTQQNDHLVIISTLEDQPFSFLVQYSVSTKPNKQSLALWIGLGIVLVMFLALGFFLIKKRKKAPSIDLSLLPARQKEIIKFILQHKGRITQAKLEKLMDLPKSSLSRNVEALVRQGFIQKIPMGTTNVLRLKK